MRLARSALIGLSILSVGACTDSNSSDTPDGGSPGVTCTATQLACDDGDTQTWASCSAGQCVTGGALTMLETFTTKKWSSGIALSADGKLLGVSSEDELGSTTGQAAFINRSTGAVVHHLDQGSMGVAFSPDSSLVAVGTSPVVVLSTSDFSEVATLANTLGPVAFSPDGSTVAAVWDGAVKFFATSDWSEQGQVVHTSDLEKERIWTVAFSPDGSVIATASGQVGFGSPHGATRLWKRSDLSPLRDLDCHSMDAAFSPDGRRIATACWQDVKIWDAASGELIRTVSTSQTFGVSVAFSPDGQQLAIGTFGGGAWLVDVETGERRDVLADDSAKTPLPSIKSLRFDPSNGTLFGGAWNDTRTFDWTLPGKN